MVLPVLLALAADLVDVEVDLVDFVFVDVDFVDFADFVDLVDLADFLAVVLVLDFVADALLLEPVDLLERRPDFLDFAFSAIAVTACSNVTDSWVAPSGSGAFTLPCLI